MSRDIGEEASRKRPRNGWSVMLLHQESNVNKSRHTI